MRKLDWIELALIAIAGVAVWWLAPSLLPERIGVDRLALAAGALLLAQSLVRDLYLLARKRGQAAGGAEQRVARCMCVESTVGMAAVLAGLLLLGFGAGGTLSMHAWAWTALVALTLLAGFISKDYVLTWDPLALVRDPDHINIVVSFRK